MAVLICKKTDTLKSNKFYDDCIENEAVCVIVKTSGNKADVEFDAHTLGDQARSLLLKDATPLIELADQLYREFGEPKLRERSKGYIIAYSGMYLDEALEISRELNSRLENMISKI